jgi:hypothetical protein
VGVSVDNFAARNSLMTEICYNKVGRGNFINLVNHVVICIKGVFVLGQMRQVCPVPQVASKATLGDHQGVPLYILFAYEWAGTAVKLSVSCVPRSP